MSDVRSDRVWHQRDGKLVAFVPEAGVERLREERNEFADLLTEGVRQDFGTPGWRARAIKAGCLVPDITVLPSTRADYELQLEWQRQAEDAGSTDV